MSTIPLSAQLAEVRREIAMRQRVYPRWVTAGRISQAEATERLATMEAIRQTLVRLIDAEKKAVAPELF